MSSHSTDHGAIVVVGSGPGIGVHVASIFASRGFKKIILLSRDAARLSQDAASVKEKSRSNAAVHTVRTDIADTAELKESLAEVDKVLENTPLECVLFNAARVGPSKLLEFPVGEIEDDLKTTVTGLYTTAQWAMPQLLEITNDPSKKPSLLVPNSMLHNDPWPQLFSLSLSKAAQYNLTHSLAREFGPQGVHCALVKVCAQITDDQEYCNPTNIAERTWDLFTQDKESWTLEVEIKEQ
ncbi:putative short-chain alcohol protein [Neofusicoccum parvum]|uniref:Short-chain alcohol protein n=1 Tax=Neofusicoccum parvum TaxID=310453 RepID=A0ACB5RW34_9PEZI|nr:putative short-chain alcohol protein [Neofusicoccum parvum]